MRPPPTAVPRQLVTPHLTPRPSPCSLAACRTSAVARRRISPVLARHSPVLCVLPPARPAPGSPSDGLALPHYDVVPDSANEDRGVPTVPAFGRPADHPFDYFPRSAVRSVHGPRSLHAPTELTVD